MTELENTPRAFWLGAYSPYMISILFLPTERVIVCSCLNILIVKLNVREWQASLNCRFSIVLHKIWSVVSTVFEFIEPGYSWWFIPDVANPKSSIDIVNGVYSCATRHSIRRVERKYKTQQTLVVTRFKPDKIFFSLSNSKNESNSIPL